MMRFLFALIVAALFQAAPLGALADSQDPILAPVTISHFSGKPVPRFERLKAPLVYGRAGPSFDHPVRWEYRREGLPVLVLKESIEWRRIRDPDGDEVWIHTSLLSSGSTALTLRPVVLRQHPSDEAGAVLRAEAGVVAALLTCEGPWCRIGLDRLKGWVRRDALWGAAMLGEPL